MSDTTSLLLQHLQVRRMPGIRDAFALETLSERVNLIHGPNGSGKTSTASAIECMLWPHDGAHTLLSASARYAFGGSDYLVELDAGHVSIQRDGKPGKAPHLPAPEFRQRYRLSLHELLRGSESGAQFAEEIRRQSSGGYDFAAAHERLGFSPKPSSSGSELAQLVMARARLQDATSKQAALHAEATALDVLERRRDAAAPAAASVALLEKAIRHARVSTDLTAGKAHLASLNQRLHYMDGDEASRFDALQSALARTDVELEAERWKAEQAAQAASIALPNGALSGDVLPTLQADVSALEHLEAERREAERRLAEREAQREEARRHIGEAVSDAQLSAIDGVRFGELADIARQAEAVAAKVKAAEAEVRLTTGIQVPGDMDATRDGVRLLSLWLAETSRNSDRATDDRGRRLLVWLLAVVAIVTAALLALQWHPVAGTGVVAAMVLAVLATRRKPAAVDTSAARRDDYVKLGIPTPAAWNAESVASQLDTLCRQLAEGRTCEAKIGWRREAEARRAELHEDLAKLADASVRVARLLGVAPDADTRTLSYLMDRIARWQDARQACEGARAECSTARAQFAAALAQTGSRLETFGYPIPSSCQAAAGALADLRRREREHGDATVARNASEQRLQALGRERAQVKSAIDDICTVAGLDAPDLLALQALCVAHSAYEKARNQVGKLEHEVQLLRADVEKGTGYEPSLLDMPLEMLELQCAEAAALADEYAPLLARCAALRSQVDGAKRESKVEEALAAVAEAEERLRERRAADLRAMIGDALMTHVQQVTRDEHRPPVFVRARELFATLTNGRYVLEFEDGVESGTPCFRAVDTRTGGGHDLDQLSSASRVQLLLAVRIAFVETQEHGVRLPLFLDETLGTSDDVRAQAIIDAVITLARGGRQVFYFTAQSDEVTRWVAALEAQKMPYRCIDLAKQRALGTDDGSSALAMPSQGRPPALPAIGQHTHASYSAELQLPRVRPGIDLVAATHLWYLIDDLPALYRLLSRGVSTWGELDALVAHGGAAILGDRPTVLARARVLAKAVAIMHEQAAIGRGRPVDRVVLLESGAVSDKKIDEVVELASRCGGRATELLAALERKEVPGFHAKKAAELREFLEREQFLDPNAPRTHAEIRSAMLGTVMDAVQAGVIGENAVDELLGRIRDRAARDASSGAGVDDDADVSPTAVASTPGHD